MIQKQFVGRFKQRALKPRSLQWVAALAVLIGLFTYRLGNLTGGLSQQEYATAAAPVGFSGTYHYPFYLPLQLLRSLVFSIFPEHGEALTRLPNALFGILAIVSFAWLVWLWHGRRTAIMATAMFATAAWTLHTSRYASFDVLYLWAVPTLLLVQLLMQQARSAVVWYGGLFLIASMLYIPGMVWFLLAGVVFQRKMLRAGWNHYKTWQQRLATVAAVIVWLPLLIIHLLRPGQFANWLGLPDSFIGFSQLGKQFAGVFVHLFMRGPQYPELWLGQLPLLDAFSLVGCGLGIWFYAKHWRSRRSKLLAWCIGIGVLLVTAGGAVGLSVLVPLLYIAIATGLAVLLHEWLAVFPQNPVARRTGIILLGLAVSMSIAYNLRSYFVAWPQNDVTQSVFRYHR